MRTRTSITTVVSEPSCLSNVIAAIVLILLFCLFIPAASAQSTEAPPATVFVQTALGGFILGYDIDQNGNEGLLSEALSLSDGKFNVATETFDQTTGKIIKIVSQQSDTLNDFVTLGIFGSSVGLVEFEKAKGIFVGKRLYGTMNPVSLNKVTGQWTPPLSKTQLILGVADSQGATNTAVLASQNFNSFIFSSNVAANTFGPSITLTDQIFGANDSPVVAINTVTNQAIVAASHGSILDLPQIAEVDLTTGNTIQFTGVGFGFVNGMAVDSTNGIAVTTSEVDFSVEFYNLAKQTGFKVPLHNATNQSQSRQGVGFDPIHKLFLIEQEFSSTVASGSSIQVFDEQGNFVEAVNGLNLPASPTRIALNPTRRMGYVLLTPALTQLQSFTY